MITTAPRSSSEAEFQAFAATCERLAGFNDRLDPFYVDGWLAVLACGPVRLPAAQWLELLAEDAFERTFADPPDHAQALATLQARLEVLWSMLDAEALLQAPDAVRLDPFFDDWNDEPAEPADTGQAAEIDQPAKPEVAVAAEAAEPTEDAVVRDPQAPPDTLHESQAGMSWAEGALEALDVLAAPAGPWGLSGDDADVLATIDEFGDQLLALLFDRDSDDYRGFIAKYHRGKTLSRDDLLLNACFALQDLRLFLLDHGPRPDTRRVEKQPGRNDPCPCGSGKKFKKCHGAAGPA